MKWTSVPTTHSSATHRTVFPGSSNVCLAIFRLLKFALHHMRVLITDTLSFSIVILSFTSRVLLFSMFSMFFIIMGSEPPSWLCGFRSSSSARIISFRCWLSSCISSNSPRSSSFSLCKDESDRRLRRSVTSSESFSFACSKSGNDSQTWAITERQIHGFYINWLLFSNMLYISIMHASTFSKLVGLPMPLELTKWGKIWILVSNKGVIYQGISGMGVNKTKE